MTVEQIWDEVERFRSIYLTGNLQYLPVDVFTILELDLQFNVIPFPDLFEKYDVDAALLPDFSGIYIDESSYVNLEKGPAWKQKRLRFSVLHELGHFWLHSDIPFDRSYCSFQEWAEWTRSNEGRKYWIEQEANEFAGRLLVPLDTLRTELDRLNERLPNWHPNEETSASVCGSRCPQVWRYVVCHRSPFGSGRTLARILSQKKPGPARVGARSQNRWRVRSGKSIAFRCYGVEMCSRTPLVNDDPLFSALPHKPPMRRAGPCRRGSKVPRAVCWRPSSRNVAYGRRGDAQDYGKTRFAR